MAILSAEQLVELRRKMAEGLPAVTWDKPTINAALQAIENWFEANRSSLANAIETAAPGAFGTLQKVRLVKFWLLQKFERGG